MAEQDTIFVRWKGKLYALPVTPSIITIADPQDIRRDVIINLGEIVDVGIRKPLIVSFSSFFPEFRDTYYNPNAYNLEDPMVWVNRFKSFRRSPIDIEIPGLGIKGLYLLSEFIYKRVGGVGKDIEYSVKFVEFQSIGIRRTDLDNSSVLEVTNINRSKGLTAASFYLAKRFDTWTSMGNLFGISPVELMKINDRVNKYDLRVDDAIRIANGDFYI